MTEVFFTDALTGVDGTSDPAPSRWAPETFGDALAVMPARGTVAVQVPAPATPAAVTTSPGSNADRGYDAVRAPQPVQAGRAPSGRVAAGRPGAMAAPSSARGARPALQPGAPTGWTPNPLWAPPAPARPAAPTPARPAAPMRAQLARPTGTMPAAPLGARPAVPRPAAAPRTASYSVAGHPNAARPQQPSRLPPGQLAPSQTRPHKKSGGAWTLLVVVIFFLVMSGAGRQILDALTHLLNR